MLCYVMLCYVMLCYVMLCYVMLCYVMLCYVKLDLFPKAPLGKIAWVGFSLGFDLFHVCGYTLINCPRGTESLYPI